MDCEKLIVNQQKTPIIRNFLILRKKKYKILLKKFFKLYSIKNVFNFFFFDP